MRSTTRPTTRSSASNPAEPLPPEYPSDKAFFTVTFYYNEAAAPDYEARARATAFSQLEDC